MPSPNILFISKADFVSKQITFIWSHAVNMCPDLKIHYNILASNCGSCPTTTNHTTVVSANVPTNDCMCIFAVQTVICENISGNETEKISLYLLPFPTSTSYQIQ